MKNKKGLSIVIGYVLLIVISIVMSIIVYQWLKTYVPKEAVKCSEGTSLFIKEVYYNCTGGVLNVSVKNNGKFSINGYFIHASNKTTGEELATLDLSSRIIDGGVIYGNSIMFGNFTENALAPNEPSNVKNSAFNVTGFGTLTKLEIIPTRMQEIEEKTKFVSCGDSKVEASLSCAT